MDRIKKYWSLPVFVAVSLLIKFLFDNNRLFRKEIIKQECSGFIEKKFYDEKRKGLATVLLDGHTKVQISNKSVFEMIEPHDYLIKIKGHLDYQLVHNIDTIHFFQCYKDMEIKE